MIYKVLVIGHLLGDFYLQSDNLATAKGKKTKTDFDTYLEYLRQSIEILCTEYGDKAFFHPVQGCAPNRIHSLCIVQGKSFMMSDIEEDRKGRGTSHQTS